MLPGFARVARWLVVAVGVAGAAAAHAQDGGDAARRPTFVRVEDPQGAPLAGAVVTFAGAIPHVGVESGPRDVLRVQTDARGRAQAKLHPGFCYIAFAVGSADDAGAQREAAPSAWFGAGSLVTLQAGEPLPPVRVRIIGREAWRHVGPLRVVVCTPTPGDEHDLELDADGAAAIPRGPWVAIEVRSADGAPLWHGAVPPAAADVALPPPRPVRVRAVDEAGAAVAGATVRARVGRLLPWRQESFACIAEYRWRDLGSTDGNGVCTVEVPYAADPLREPTHGDMLLFVRAAGRPAVVGGVVNGDLFVDDRRAAKRTLDEFVFTLRRVAPLAGALGKVPRGTTVHLAAACKMFLAGTSYRNDMRAFVAPVADDGTFVFDDVPAELHSSRVSLLPPDAPRADWPSFPALPGRELPAQLTTADPPPLLASQYADLTVRFVEPNGGPSRGTIAFLTSRSNAVLVRDSTVRLPLDARGAATMRLLPGAWIVVAATDTGWAARALELAAGPTSETLAMEPPASMQLELLGAGDEPIGGASIVLRGTTTRGTGDPVQSVLQGLRMQWRERWESLRTDARGRIAIPFLPVEGVAQKFALLWPGGVTADLTMVPTSSWQVVRPR